MKDTHTPDHKTSDQGMRDQPIPNRHSRSLVGDVVDHIRRQIVSGDLIPGEKLPTEQQMMRGLGVSRTVIREAISQLQAAELVETRHGIGTFVLECQEKAMAVNAKSSILSLADVLSMLDFRICLETQAAGLAAIKRTNEDLAAFEAVSNEFVEQVLAGGNAADADLNFHLHVGKATGNRYFEDVYRFMGQNTIPRSRINITQYTTQPRESYLMQNHNEHQAVVDAIIRQDQESAQAAMRLHLVNSRERLREALQRFGQ